MLATEGDAAVASAGREESCAGGGQDDKHVLCNVSNVVSKEGGGLNRQR